ncbi:hypothetical protein LB504_011054 [Fusarium proliferatum]|nr:hypothetical protein LB504_011054 [Fusarium proliferatum]
MSPYEGFRQNFHAVHVELPNPSTEYPTMTDIDGSILYEQQFYRLRTAIIERNDTVALEKYLQNAPWAVKRGHALGTYYDPFIVAARHGSLDALKILLDHYYTFIKPVGRTDLDGRCCRVLNTAAIDNLEKKEVVINFLLDRGARVSDAEYTWDYYLDPITGESIHKQVPVFMTLNFAAEWAGADLIRRLIESGADPHVKMMEDKEFTVRTDVTIISTVSRCANVDALKVLLECASKVGDVGAAVSYHDSWGSMPLHWACQVSMDEDPREVSETVMEDKVQRIITTLSLLLDCSPETINEKDNNYGQEHTAIVQYLCGRGADSSILNEDGETAFHSLCSHDGGLPIDTDTIQILLDHGAKVTDTDNEGNTPLHLAVKNLENLEAIASLLDHGADIRAKNLKGNTPLHQAANGMFWPGVVEEKHKSMGDILRRLQGDGGYLMHEPSAEGKSPWQIQDEVRKDLKEKMDDIEIERKW